MRKKILFILILFITPTLGTSTPITHTRATDSYDKNISFPSNISIKGTSYQNKQPDHTMILREYNDIEKTGWLDPYFYLAAYWAPTIYQDTDDTYYKGDYITNFDFDGDWVGNNNWENLDNYDNIWAYVYYAVIETETHYFIFYMFFHPRDWNDIPDAGIGEHENDMEGAMIVITKDGSKYGSFLLMETRAHLDFYQYSNDPNIGSGSDDIDGGVIFDGNRPTVSIEAKGHGVYAWDGTDFPGGDGVVYRYYSNVSQFPENGNDRNVTYALIPILKSLWPRRYNIGDGLTYDVPFYYQGARFSFVNQIPEAFDGDTNVADAANPPWGMDDGDDGNVYKGDWFLDCAYTVNTHLSIPYTFSLNYDYNPYLNESGPEFNYPTITIYEPNAGSYIDSRSVTISWEVSDESPLFSLEVSVNGTTYYNSPTLGYNSITITLPSDGLYQLNITAVDYWGNYRKVLRTFIVDTTPPVPEILSPTNNSYLNTSNVEVSWNITDNIEFDHVDLYIDDTYDSTYYQAEYNITLLFEDGEHKIEIIAYDMAGNYNSDAVYIKIDTTPPSIAITSPENDTYTSNTTITIYWDASDNMNLTRFDVYRNNTKIAELDATENSYSLTLSEGDYIIKVVAYDYVQHTNFSEILIHVDLSDPYVQIYQPNNNSYVTTTFTLKWTASDNYGLDYFEIYLNSSLIDTLEGSIREYNVTLPSLGSFIVRVIGYDIVGHNSFSEIVVYLDDSPPVIEYCLDNCTIFYSDTVFINWTIHDDHEVAHRYIKVDSNDYVEIYKDNITLILEDGEHNIYVKAVDSAGNIAIKMLVIYVDTKPPSLYVIKPENNTYYNSPTIPISWSASDECGIDRSVIRIDSSAEYTVYNYSIAVTLEDGQHTITITVYDIANRTDIKTVIIIVDTAPPVLILSAPENNTKHMHNITIAWESSDDLSDIYEIAIIINDTTTYTTTNPIGNTTLFLDPGVYEIKVVSTDNANNSNSVMVVIYIVQIDIISPSPYENISSQQILLYWKTMYIDYINVYLNGSEVGTIDASLGYTSITLPSEGFWEISICDSNQIEFSSSVIIQADWTIPVIEYVDYEQLVNVSEVSIGWCAYDAVSGIAVVHVIVNDSEAYSGRDNETTLSLDEGFWFISIVVMDYANNTATENISITVDLTAPSVILYPADSSVINNTFVEISWVVNDEISGVESIIIFFDGDEILETRNDSSIVINVTDGEHIISLRATDIAGNSILVSHKIFVSAPSVLVVSGISNQSYVNNGTIEISWWLYNGEIMEQYLYVDDQEYNITSNYSVLFLDEGVHKIKIVVRDDEGSITSKTYLLYIDLTPPTLSILSPANNSIINKTRIDLILNLTENMEIDKIIINVNGRMLNTTNLRVSLELDEGDNIIEVWAFDRAGNYDLDKLILRVDTIAPYVKIVEPKNGTTFNESNITLSWYVKENIEIKKIEILLNGMLIESLEQNTSAVILLLNNTENIIIVRVYDIAGNIGKDHIIVFLNISTSPTTSTAQTAFLQNVPRYNYYVSAVLIPAMFIIVFILAARRRKQHIIEHIEEESIDLEVSEIEDVFQEYDSYFSENSDDTAT